MSQTNKEASHFRRKKNKEYIKSFYTECAHCGSKEALTFHHMDPSKKHRELGKMCNYNRKKIDEELAKGVILCETCHLDLHQNSSIWWLIKFKTRILWNKIRKSALGL